MGPDRSVAVVQLRFGLLDGDRVHGHGPPGSRSFNILYQLCAGTPHDPDSLLQIQVWAVGPCGSRCCVGYWWFLSLALSVVCSLLTQVESHSARVKNAF